MKRHRILKHCKMCHHPFEVRVSEWHAYATCSPRCRSRYRSVLRAGKPLSLQHRKALSRALRGRKCPWNIKRRFPVLCNHCRKTFFVVKSRIPIVRFCSRQCRVDGLRTSITSHCETCRKQIRRPPVDIRTHRHLFCSWLCRFQYQKGAQSPRWKGGRYQSSAGYIVVHVGPNKTNLEHRVVMEKSLQRKLRPMEVVHHLNGRKDDNRKENLLCMSPQEHRRLHARKCSSNV